MAKKSGTPDHYQIKFRKKGTEEWIYAIFYRPYSGDELEIWESSRTVIISDAILPRSYELKYDDLEIVDLPLCIPLYDKVKREIVPNGEFEEYIEQKHEEAKAKAAASTTMKDKLFRIGVGDGSACYVIVKENKKTVRVEWRGFAGADRYIDQMIGWKSTVNKEKIANMIDREEGLKKLFG